MAVMTADERGLQDWQLGRAKPADFLVEKFREELGNRELHERVDVYGWWDGKVPRLIVTLRYIGEHYQQTKHRTSCNRYAIKAGIERALEYSEEARADDEREAAAQVAMAVLRGEGWKVEREVGHVDFVISFNCYHGGGLSTLRRRGTIYHRGWNGTEHVAYSEPRLRVDGLSSLEFSAAGLAAVLDAIAENAF